MYCIRLTYIILTGLLCQMACAIDNPDAPDYITAFKMRAKAYESAVDDPSLTNRGILQAYENYLLFLDRELNMAYQLIHSKLPPTEQVKLKKSQHEWLHFRDAEFNLIQNNWTRENFGSSAGLSRGAYRCRIIEDRILQLLLYVKNY